MLKEILKDSQGVPTGSYKDIAGGTLWADSPIGSILPYGGATAPAGWMICDGTSLLRASYPELFAVIGTAFGSADSTHFNIPDMTGKTAMGVEAGHAIGASEVGALPNIKSATQNATVSWATGGDIDPNSAIYSGGVAYTGGANLGSDGAWNYIRMDASRSSSIYTDGQTKVDPANVRVNYIIKAKMVALPADLASGVEEVVEGAFIYDDYKFTLTNVTAGMGNQLKDFTTHEGYTMLSCSVIGKGHSAIIANANPTSTNDSLILSYYTTSTIPSSYVTARVVWLKTS